MQMKYKNRDRRARLDPSIGVRASNNGNSDSENDDYPLRASKMKDLKHPSKPLFRSESDVDITIHSDEESDAGSLDEDSHSGWSYNWAYKWSVFKKIHHLWHCHASFNLAEIFDYHTLLISFQFLPTEPSILEVCWNNVAKILILPDFEGIVAYCRHNFERTWLLGSSKFCLIHAKGYGLYSLCNCIAFLIFSRPQFCPHIRNLAAFLFMHHLILVSNVGVQRH